MLVKAGRVIDDIFTPAADADPLPNGPVIVSVKRFQAEKAALLARRTPLGVKLETSETPQILAADLRKLALVAFHIPQPRDGRAFSWVRLLRGRLGFRGEIRISGHFLLDQIAFYTRVGADAFDIAQDISAESVKAALTEISDVYQPSVDGRQTIWDLREGNATVAPS